MASDLPTKVIAGVTVVDTPLVRAAQEYARKYNDDMTFNHSMRSWLFGVTLYQRLHKVAGFPELDLEAHAVSAILHDLGWDTTGELTSTDKRFEVDGAIAARNWIQEQVKDGNAKEWDQYRQQVVWDAIALHSTPSIGAYKEPVVQVCGLGIVCDFQGPNSDPTKLLTWDDFNAVKAEFPRHNLAAGIREKIVHFCNTKPQTTYENWQMEYGRKYVEGYKEKEELIFPIIEGSL